jgi:TonB-dependent SusC/RagA subfamily outer membrane receptor
MNWKPIIVSVLALLYSIALFGQSTLFNSQRQSSDFYIYRLTPEVLKKIHIGEMKFNEAMLTDFVQKGKYNTQKSNLPRGNYVEVRAEENNLVYHEFIVDDLYVKVIPTEAFAVCLYDSLGNAITDALVTLGKYKVSYDIKLGYYKAKNAKTDDIVSILHKKVYHYLRVEKNWPYEEQVSFWQGMKNTWGQAKYKIKRVFRKKNYRDVESFMVFSKPMYKPNDQVKFKAYLEKGKWKPNQDTVDVHIMGYGKDTVITNLAPYRPGMYAYSFDLNAGLGLTLDKHYRIVLQSSKSKNVLLEESFRYEDYELKSLTFSMKSERTDFAKGDSIRLKLKVVNENDMPIYDGRVELKVVPNPYRMSKMKANQVNFIPDTLWQTTVSLTEVAEKEIVLPDSIFPSDLGLSFQVVGTYLSSDNERHEKLVHLNLLDTEKEIRIAVKDGQAEIKYFEQGIEKVSEAKIELWGENGEMLRTEHVRLPHIMPVAWQATEIGVEANGISELLDLEREETEQLSYRFYRTTDSVLLTVHNPAAIPFWYQIRKAKKMVAAGYATQLNRAFAERGKDGYSMQITYLFAGRVKVMKEDLPFVQKNLNLEVNTATTVYPGQKAEVQLSVTDKAGKPVQDVDITAYGFTTKFQNTSAPKINIGGLMRSAQQFQNFTFNLDEDQARHREALQDWARWSKEMQLDTIAFYQFLFPKDYYQASLPIAEIKSQISPYLVVNGLVQGVHMMWIDGLLTYAKQSQHHDDYIFEIYPGRHEFKFRTTDREVVVKGFQVEKGRRTIVSFNAAQDTLGFNYPDETVEKGQIIVKVLPKKDVGKLQDAEVTELKKQLISVTHNFGAWQLPNLNAKVEMPAYIQTSGDLFYLNPKPNTNFDTRLRTQVPAPVLVGPFPRTEMYKGVPKIATLMIDTTTIGRFEIEGGYQYTLYQQYQKLKSWDPTYIRHEAPDFKPQLDFAGKLWTRRDINQHVARKFREVMQQNRGVAQFILGTKEAKEPTYNLNLSYGRDVDHQAIQPVLIFFEPSKAEDRRYYRLYYGGENSFHNLPVGDVIVHVVKDDSTAYSQAITLQANGLNYLKLDAIEWNPRSPHAALAYKMVHDETVAHRALHPLRDGIPQEQQSVGQELNINKDQFIANRNNNASARILVYDGDAPVIGAKVINLYTKQEYFTHFDGSIELDLSDEKAIQIQIMAIGYNTADIRVSKGQDYFVELKAQANQLEEVVVMGYAGSEKRMAMTGSVQTISSSASRLLEGKVSGVFIRGNSHVVEGAKPLVLVDGVVFEGDLASLDPNIIASLNTVKDQSMIALYGSRAANGVIMVQTKSGAKPEIQAYEAMPYMESGNTMRVNFRDDAFWQPKLTTDGAGKASFETTYPDDMTNWRTIFIAKGVKDFADTKELNIKSFKAVSAHLAAPRFAIRDDQFTAIGRVVNYLGDSLEVLRTIDNGADSIKANLKIGKSYRDPIAVRVAKGDSLQLSYAIRLSNGYFDGERRSIPIFERGLEQHQGDFKVLNGTEEYQLKTAPAGGEITVHAEANSWEFVQREIAHIDAYQFLCNEQLASKLSALLSKKQLAKLLGKPFEEEKKIHDILKELQKNKNATGGWGWWNKSETVSWISNYVLGVLLDAEDAGYQTTLVRKQYIEREEDGLKNSLASLDVLWNKDKLSIAQEGLFSSLLFLNRLDPKTDYKNYFFAIDGKLKSKSTKDILLKYLLMAKMGIADAHAADTVLKYASKTILGGMYWSSRQVSDNKERIFMNPTETHTENTLLAYAALKTMGGRESDLELIRNYFFAQKQQGNWSNIYESSRIIRSILPDLLKEGETFQAPVAIVNGNRIATFPYTQTFAPTEQISVRKEGTGPLFVTAYQNFWNANPTIQKDKGLSISTRFKDANGTVTTLKEGKPIKIEVTVALTGEAEYIQLEVPIPAGCTYETKSNGYYRKEAHREHFKDRVVIFFPKLNEGSHTFEIELLPRYTGAYTLNPAKAELMYFPIFYGHEKLKEIVVE